MTTKKKLTREQVIRALRRLEAGWPDDIYLWAQADGRDICLMEKRGGYRVLNRRGEVKESSMIAGFNIETDGGFLGTEDEP